MESHAYVVLCPVKKAVDTSSCVTASIYKSLLQRILTIRICRTWNTQKHNDQGPIPTCCVAHAYDNVADGAAVEGSLHIVGGEETPDFVYGRLRVFLNGFWGEVCSTESLTPDAAQAACKVLGYDGGAQLPRFRDGIFRSEITADYAERDYAEVLMPHPRFTSWF